MKHYEIFWNNHQWTEKKKKLLLPDGEVTVSSIMG